MARPTSSSTRNPTTELRFEWLHPTAAEPNPLNWWRHPKRQTDALDTLIFGEGGVGWAGVVLVNARRPEHGWAKDSTPTVIDGHARQKLALLHDEPVPPHLRSDNGSEFTAGDLRTWLDQLTVKPLFI